MRSGIASEVVEAALRVYATKEIGILAVGERDVQISMLSAKIHRARVTGAELHYQGSITLSSELLAASGILPGQEVLVVNVMNGERLTTYAIEGEQGIVCMNGPSARRVQVGDLVIVIAFALCDPDEARTLVPRVVHVDDSNRPLPSKT